MSARTRWAIGITFFVTAACLGLGTVADAHNKTARAGCGNKVVFLVWPNGHPAITRFSEFPKIPNPHIELYTGTGGNYNAQYAGAWVIGGKPPAGITRGGFFTACANFGDTVTTGTVKNARVVTSQTAVKCSFKGSPVTDVALRAGGVADFYLHSGRTMLAIAHATKNGVALTIPKSGCSLAPAPRP